MNYQILVNKNHPISQEWMKQNQLYPLVERDKIFYMHQKAMRQYLKLKRRVYQKTGIIIALDSTYRSLEEQKKIITEMKQEYGELYTSRFVSKVGESEHHTGLAIDLTIYHHDHYLTNNYELEAAIDQFSQIYPFLGYYGFILRYPKGKEHITKIPFEIWHIRYVGVKAAKDLKRKHQVLEQYKKKL